MWYILYKERSDTKDIGTSKKKQSTRAWAVATSNTLREVWPPRQPCIIHTTFRSLIGLLLILPYIIYNSHKYWEKGHHHRKEAMECQGNGPQPQAIKKGVGQ